jgi:hypothetical protein
VDAGPAASVTAVCLLPRAPPSVGAGRDRRVRGPAQGRRGRARFVGICGVVHHPPLRFSQESGTLDSKTDENQSVFLKLIKLFRFSFVGLSKTGS